MIRDTTSYSLDSCMPFKVFSQNKCPKPIYLLKTLIKKRKLRPKSDEATDTEQYNIGLSQGKTRRKSCYCSECGSQGKMQQRYRDLQIKRLPKPVNKLINSSDRRCTLNVQSINRSIFFRRNTQKTEKNEMLKSPTYDLGDCKSPGWFLRQMTKKKSIISVQKLMDTSCTRNQQRSFRKILVDGVSQGQSQQTISMPICLNSPGIRIRTLGAYESDAHINSPKNIPKISPYLSYRQINLNLLIPIRQKSISSTLKKPKRKLFSYSKS